MEMLGILVFAAAIVLTWWAIVSWNRRHRALQRLHEHDDVHTIAIGGDMAVADNALSRWLARAGYRRPDATTLFLAATIGCGFIGLAIGQIYRVTLQTSLIERVIPIPGTAGEALAEVLSGGAWVLFILAALTPMSIVRSARRARAIAIEQDLPLALEMLATMAEAGLGFDAALTNIIRTRGGGRPLAAEFNKFQLDMLAGMPRPQALRQLARRVHVPSLTSFTSALIQAELVGASIAETLQHQAADLRQRRREEALLHAQAMPVKLVFPLVICFLPGVFLSTLAPAIYQMFEVANGVLRSGG